MTAAPITPSQRFAARVAGIACLLGMATVVFAHYGITRRLLSPDAAETARNILSHAALLRLNIGCDLVYVIGILVLLTALYTILAPVHRGLALLAAASWLVYAVAWLVGTLSLYVVLRLLRAPAYLSAFDTAQVHSLARFYAGGGFEAYYVGLPFYGLASTVCSYLWLRSRYIPRALAAFGVVASAWCLASAFAFILVPHFSKVVNLYWLDSPMGIFEMATSVWLVLKGLSPAARPATVSG